MKSPSACTTATVAYPNGRTGTNAGYQAHAKAREPACPACREASRLRGAAIRETPGFRARRRAYYDATRMEHAARNLMFKSNLTLDQYADLLAQQDGRCAICGSSDPAGRWKTEGRFHVDHDHSCCPGKSSCGQCVRGLLCGKCNVGLGAFRDEPEILFAAAAYLMTANRKEAANAASAT